MPKGYVIVNVRVRRPEDYPEYARRAEETVTRHGGRYLIRGAQADIAEGAPSVGRYVVLEFPSLAAAKGWYASADYRAVLGLRQRAADSELFFIEGYDPAARSQ